MVVRKVIMTEKPLLNSKLILQSNNNKTTRSKLKNQSSKSNLKANQLSYVQVNIQIKKHL